MTRRDLIIKWLAYGVALAVITALNYSVFTRLPMALPLLLPMAAVAAGTLEGPAFGAVFGTVAGALMVCVGYESLLAIPALAVLGWLCGMLTQFILRRDLVGHTLCALLTLVVWELFQVGWRLVGGVADLSTLLSVALPELLWTFLFSFPVYWLCRFCCIHYGRIYHE